MSGFRTFTTVLVFMKFLSILFFVETAFGSVHDMVLPIQIDSYRNRPIMTGSYERSDQRFDFVLDLESNTIYHPDAAWMYEGSLNFYTSADGQNGNSQVLSIPIPSGHREYDITYSVGAGFDSDFGRIAGTMMLVPRELPGHRRGFQMVLNPTNPESFCFENRILRTNFFPGQTTFHAEVSLRRFDDGSQIALITGSTDGESATAVEYGSGGSFYLSSLRSEISLPFPIRRTIASMIRGAGVRVGTPSRGTTFLGIGCASIIPTLPAIEISIMEDGETVGNLVLNPDDYVTVGMGGLCQIHLDMDERAISDQNELSLGRTFFETLGVFYDYSNRQLGFCDPL